MDDFICECFTCRYRDVNGAQLPCSECTDFLDGVFWEPRTFWQKLKDWWRMAHNG